MTDKDSLSKYIKKKQKQGTSQLNIILNICKVTTVTSLAVAVIGSTSNKKLFYIGLFCKLAKTEIQLES